MSETNGHLRRKDASEEDTLTVSLRGKVLVLEGARWQASLPLGEAMRLRDELCVLLGMPEKKQAGATENLGKGF